jgi:hypothetical protein
MRTLYGLAIASMIVAAIGGAQAEVRRFTIELNGTQEQPAVVTEGRGTARMTLDTTTRRLTWNVTYRGLSGPATMAHIHGPALPGENAPVLINLAPQGMKNPLTGSAELTEAQMADLLAGKTYVNVHTEQHKAGEIRGQIYP